MANTSYFRMQETENSSTSEVLVESFKKKNCLMVAPVEQRAQISSSFQIPNSANWSILPALHVQLVNHSS